MTARRTTISIFGKDYPIPPKGLYAGVPGRGPEGKECRHCEHRQVAEYSRRFSKCRLMSDHWTHGAKTDIQATAPACEKFKDNVEHDRRTAALSPGVRVDGPVGPHTQED